MKRMRRNGVTDPVTSELVPFPYMPRVADLPRGWWHWSPAQKIEHLLGMSLDRAHQILTWPVAELDPLRLSLWMQVWHVVFIIGVPRWQAREPRIGISGPNEPRLSPTKTVSSLDLVAELDRAESGGSRYSRPARRSPPCCPTYRAGARGLRWTRPRLTLPITFPRIGSRSSRGSSTRATWSRAPAVRWSAARPRLRRQTSQSRPIVSTADLRPLCR